MSEMPTFRPHRLLVVGAERVGKTALIEQFIFGNHVVGQVRACVPCLAPVIHLAMSITVLALTLNTCTRTHARPYAQRGLPTVGDTYEVCVETDKGTPEKLFIYDTPGQVSTGSAFSVMSVVCGW